MESSFQVREAFDAFPAPVRPQLLALRELVFEVAGEADDVGPIDESLKWGQPSYSATNASPVRLGVWDAERGEVAVFFNCQTSLIETFREVFGATLRFDGKRALILTDIPTDVVKQCLYLGLTYHSRKHLPLLGV